MNIVPIYFGLETDLLIDWLIDWLTDELPLNWNQQSLQGHIRPVWVSLNKNS
jgi:hypothetical protein